MKVEFSAYLKELESRPENPGAVAFFDLDRTLIAGYSVAALGWEGFKCAIVPRWRIALQLRVFFDYSLGLAHYLDLMRVTLSDVAGMAEPEFLQLGERAFHNGLAGSIYDEGRQLIAAHQALAHTVVMITSATRPQAEPFVRELGIGYLCCTELETRDGRFTGAFEPCYGGSKRDAAERFCERRAMRLGDAWFYTDGIEDLPLLEAVGCPVVVNPKTRLLGLAGQRGWPHLEFARPGEKGGTSGRRWSYLAKLRGAARPLLVDLSKKGKARVTRLRPW